MNIMPTTNVEEKLQEIITPTAAKEVPVETVGDVDVNDSFKVLSVFPEMNNPEWFPTNSDELDLVFTRLRELQAEEEQINKKFESIISAYKKRADNLLLKVNDKKRRWETLAKYYSEATYEQTGKKNVSTTHGTVKYSVTNKKIIDNDEMMAKYPSFVKATYTFDWNAFKKENGITLKDGKAFNKDGEILEEVKVETHKEAKIVL
ncbi:putative surface layer protein SlpB [Ligilactobacillus equi DPC 6820]|uniref:Putative surface layer protein SlpB n=2 Tax=Ligilactobacillus equi TaxID=137357 RepID=V7HZR4_9LACO|nr:putative surface layer protein SlpB [Ligilactobacillus equi DPC 6820]